MSASVVFPSSKQIFFFPHQVQQPILTYPGAYRKVTVELKVLKIHGLLTIMVLAFYMSELNIQLIYQCIFGQIHHLAVDALLKSNKINELEGGALLGFESNMNSGAHNPNEQDGFDEATSCAPAFRVLKQLIQRCLGDAVASGNVYADAILQHLYRWLCRFNLLIIFIPHVFA